MESDVVTVDVSDAVNEADVDWVSLGVADRLWLFVADDEREADSLAVSD